MNTVINDTVSNDTVSDTVSDIAGYRSLRPEVTNRAEIVTPRVFLRERGEICTRVCIAYKDKSMMMLGGGIPPTEYKKPKRKIIEKYDLKHGDLISYTRNATRGELTWLVSRGRIVRTTTGPAQTRLRVTVGDAMCIEDPAEFYADQDVVHSVALDPVAHARIIASARDMGYLRASSSRANRAVVFQPSRNSFAFCDE